MRVEAHAVSPRALLHQEGVLGLVAVVALAFRDRGPVASLQPADGWIRALVFGAGTGLAIAAALWVIRRLPPLMQLEDWQRRLVSGWTPTDAAAVALLSGVAEEALMRAVLQPVVGLVPAAALFAVLHVVPDRRLWLWPVLAFMMGVVFGWLFSAFGFPAAAAAHVTMNGLSLARLRRRAERDGGPES